MYTIPTITAGVFLISESFSSPIMSIKLFIKPLFDISETSAIVRSRKLINIGSITSMTNIF